MGDDHTIFVKDTITAFLVEEKATRLSLAVRLVDDYTDTQPIGRIKVFIAEITRIKNGKEEVLKGIINPGGYYLFLDLPECLSTLSDNKSWFL